MTYSCLRLQSLAIAIGARLESIVRTEKDVGKGEELSPL